MASTVESEIGWALRQRGVTTAAEGTASGLALLIFMAFLLAGRAAAADPPGLILTWSEARRQRACLAARKLAAAAALARFLLPARPEAR